VSQDLLILGVGGRLRTGHAASVSHISPAYLHHDACIRIALLREIGNKFTSFIRLTLDAVAEADEVLRFPSSSTIGRS